MGYDVHITRAEEWMQSEEFPIPLDEWLAYVAGDPEMRLDGYAEVQIAGDVLRVESEGMAVWTAYTGHGIGGNLAWFNHDSGKIRVKNPDEEIIGKMRQIAEKLDSNVIGDEDEHY